MRAVTAGVALAALFAMYPSISTLASPAPGAHDRHHVSGVQTVVAPTGTAAACADRRLTRVRPGHRVRLTVRLGGTVAVLHGVANKQPADFGSDAMLRHGAVTVRADGASLRYSIPRYIPPGSGSHEVSVVGSRRRHGYLCLVRFQPDTAAVAVVGVDPLFMGGGPLLELIAANARKAHPVYADFRRWDIRWERGLPVVRTGDMRFFAVGQADADSGFPLNFFTMVDGHRRDVSADYPHQIRHDARAWWHQFNHPRHGPRLGAVAAWSADECTLGRQHHAFSVLRRLQKHGRLHTSRGLYPRSKRHYARWLERFLRHTGYAH